MCCLALITGLVGPRAGAIVWWLVSPERWDAAFSTWVWPVIGIVFLPWATMAYVLVSPHGVHGFDWVWIVSAVLVDLSTDAGGVRGHD